MGLSPNQGSEAVCKALCRHECSTPDNHLQRTLQPTQPERKSKRKKLTLKLKKLLEICKKILY